MIITIDGYFLADDSKININLNTILKIFYNNQYYIFVTEL